MTVLTDAETGLAFALPDGWRALSLPNIPLAAVRDDEVFAASLIATVSEAGSRELDDIVIDATAEWLGATPSGQIIDGHEVVDPNELDENGAHHTHRLDARQLRLLHCLYSVGVTSVALVSVFVLSEGLVTRVDLSVQAVQAHDATAVLYDLVESLVAPSRAPSVLAPASAPEFAALLQERGETIA